MKIDKLTKLKLQVNNNLNTIESIPAIDYNNGVFSAINHCCNKALELAVNGEINSNGITVLNQFCSDRMLKFNGSYEQFDKGMYEGYRQVKNAILEEV